MRRNDFVFYVTKIDHQKAATKCFPIALQNTLFVQKFPPEKDFC